MVQDKVQWPALMKTYYSLGISHIKAGIAQSIQEVDYRMNNSGVRVRLLARERIFFFSTTSRLALEPKQPPQISVRYPFSWDKATGQGVKLTTQHHPVSCSEIPEANICPFMCVQRVVLN